MLITCPECFQEASDQALACPHCGYPLKKRPSAPSPNRSHRRRRLPNGFGQISEIKNRNLRKPFRVLVTTGVTNEGRPICKPLRPNAYFKTYNEAYQALMLYHRHPFDLSNEMTMQELFELWLQTRQNKVDPSTLARYRSAWAYSSAIHNMKVIDVHISDLRNCIEYGTVVRGGIERHPINTVKDNMKTLYNLLFDYAIANDMVDKNYARMFTIESGYVRRPNRHIAYTDDELKTLWQNIDRNPVIDMVLIQCYSGWRPGEMCELRMEDVDIANATFRGGLKTKAGINRIVPIHPRILPLVKARYEKALAANSPYLFFVVHSKSLRGHWQKGDITPMRYASFQAQLVQEIVPLLSLNPAHSGHDGRVTFVTRAKEANVDEYAIKRMVGHYISDLTERVYTQRNIEWLRSEIRKIQ